MREKAVWPWSEEGHSSSETAAKDPSVSSSRAILLQDPDACNISDWTQKSTENIRHNFTDKGLRSEQAKRKCPNAKTGGLEKWRWISYGASGSQAQARTRQSSTRACTLRGLSQFNSSPSGSVGWVEIFPSWCQFWALPVFLRKNKMREKTFHICLLKPHSYG